MSFRRIPFQFSSTDPAERQRELEKRFGLPTRNKMFVENTNPLSMGSSFKESSACSSPRLQHRVPIFVEGYDQPIRSSVDSTSSVPENKKSNVRVIPIEIEGAETLPSARHRNFSGPAGLVKESNEEFLPQRDDASPLKRSMQDLTKPSKIKATTGPKVYNIPIKVEGAGTVQKGPKSEKVKTPVKKDHSEVNGCNVSKQMKDGKSVPDEQTVKPEICEEQKIKINICNGMKKIEEILDELKSYESGVNDFSGTGKDKQYRYLDEMLTRCMLRLDDIDTMGNDKVRSARKNAVKKVQSCIDLLESKVNSSNETEVTPIAENEDNNNIQEVATEILEHEVSTGNLEQNVVTEVSGQIDKGEDSEKKEVNDVEMAEIIANSVPTDDNKPVNSTKAVKLSQDDSLHNSSETKASEKPNDSNINVDLLSKISEVNDVEMVEISNAVPEVSKSVKSTVLSESASPPDDSVCNLSETEGSGKLDENKVNVSSEIPEVEMKEASSSQETNSKSQFEVELPECFEAEAPCALESSENTVHAENFKESVLQTISQDSDVEMKEVKHTLDEIKEKTSDCDTSALQGIPDEETAVTVVGESKSNSIAGQAVTESDCQSTTSQNDIIQGD